VESARNTPGSRGTRRRAIDGHDIKDVKNDRRPKEDFAVLAGNTVVAREGVNGWKISGLPDCTDATSSIGTAGTRN
jgi:hypothetical protein